MKKKLMCLLSVLFISASAFALKTGEKAPDFNLKGNDGKDYKLSDLKGKVVVLEWFNEACPYVEKHYKKTKNMQELQKKYTDKGVVWFSVISSAPGKQGHRDAAGATKLKSDWKTNQTAFLLDSAGDLGKKVGAKTTPHMFVIDANGLVVYQGAIDDKASTDAATVKTATPVFANAVDATLAKKPVTVGSTEPYGCSVKYN